MRNRVVQTGLFLLLLSLTVEGRGEAMTLAPDNHDISSLPSWGPYSKRYAGISHVDNLQSGVRFDLSVMPGYYRNRQMVPAVLFESGYHPWQTTPDLSRYTYRYELEWKDRVYCDVTYQTLSDKEVLVQMDCVNHTDVCQNLVLNLMANIDYESEQPSVVCRLPEGVSYLPAQQYQWCNRVDSLQPQYHLLYDGARRCEEKSSESLSGFLVGQDFGSHIGDAISYHISQNTSAHAGIALRYRLPAGKTARWHVAETGQQLNLTGSGNFELLPIQRPMQKGLTLVADTGQPVQLDGLFLGPEAQLKQINIESRPLSPVPDLMEEGSTQQDLLLHYSCSDAYYGLAWNFGHCEIRQLLDDCMESFFRRKTHEHVRRYLEGNNGWHFADAFLRPIVLPPHSSQRLYALLVTSRDKAEVKARLDAFHVGEEAFLAKRSGPRAKRSGPRAKHSGPRALAGERKTEAQQQDYLPAAADYAFGKQLLEATLLSNIVYPVHTQGQYIRHFTPGKNWNSLYTWDSGFICGGLIEVNPQWAYENLWAYTTPEGSESAFIHHGTPLPIQHLSWHDLLNETLDGRQMQSLYPRMRQYFRFMTGRGQGSTTRMASGLLRTWDYFYNSGGWDDYPPQKAVHAEKLQDSVTPVVSTALYLRAARILRMYAQQLGLKSDVREYDRFIAQAAQVLNDCAWDDATGYYGYVRHDAAGKAAGLFRYADTINYDMGLDGTSPLLAGVVPHERQQRLLGHLFNPQEIWSPVGLSTVAQNAPYYSPDGYWNGAVWMPHQWMVFKALLDAGAGERALQIAVTALQVWEKECRESYFTFEHFIISSQRGAGWHQFSGLSSPVLNWYASLFRLGKVTSGYEVNILEKEVDAGYRGIRLQLQIDDATAAHTRHLWVCLDPSLTYAARYNGKEVAVTAIQPGLIQVELPATNRSGKLIIQPL